MTISDLIGTNVDRLVHEFVGFARSQSRPGRRDLTDEELADSIRELLVAVADYVRDAGAQPPPTPRAPQPPVEAPSVSAYAETHALTRFRQGYRLDQLVTEYRALRALMTGLLEEARPGVAARDLAGLNEAVDQALASSVSLYVKEVERARELFIGILGHDLRNPLNAVALSSEVLLADERLGSASMRAALSIRSSAARMSRLVEDLIDFTRTRLGTRLPTSPARVELCSILSQVVDELRIANPARELVYEPPDGIWGHWDSARIGQLFSNLIGNAIQHGDPAEPVTVSARTAPACVMVAIHNRGPVIAPESRERIFEPLTRVADQRHERRPNQSSAGLGLYIAKEIARAHGGRIEVQSSPEQGTLFEVMLPREVEPGEVRDA